MYVRGYSPKYTNQSNKNSFFNKNLILSNLYPTFAPENIFLVKLKGFLQSYSVKNTHG